jgi:hypothetical protein
VSNISAIYQDRIVIDPDIMAGKPVVRGTRIPVDMPEISRFYGIIITMYFYDHEPAHFHARYGDQEADFGIDPIVLLAGWLPRRATGLVMDWAELHRNELLANWQSRNDSGGMQKVQPLQ